MVFLRTREPQLWLRNHGAPHSLDDHGCSRALSRKEKTYSSCRARVHTEHLLTNLPVAPTPGGAGPKEPLEGTTPPLRPRSGSHSSALLSLGRAWLPARCWPLPEQLSALRAPCLGTLDSFLKVLLPSAVGSSHLSFRSQAEHGILCP